MAVVHHTIMHGPETAALVVQLAIVLALAEIRARTKPKIEPATSLL